MADRSDRWRRVRRILLILLAIHVVAGGSYALWGYTLSRRYETLVDELHEMGVPTWEELTRETVPDEVNGWPLLLESKRIYDEVEEEACEGSDLWSLDPLAIDGSEWSEEEREHWLKARPGLEPCFALLEQAARRTVLVPAAEDNPWDGEDTAGILSALDLLRCEVEVDPSSAARSVPLLLDLESRWRARGSARWGVRLSLRHHALKQMREGIASGKMAVVPLLARMRASLDAWDPQAEGHRARHVQAMQWIWICDEYRAGRDPFREMREMFEEIRDLAEGAEGGEALADIHVPPTGWATSWLARPLMLRGAITMLEKLRDGLAEEFTVERIRREAPVGLFEHLALVDLASSRLARLALRIVAHREEHADLPTSLSDLEPAVPADLLIDPFSGEQLRFERDGESVVISSSLPGWMNRTDVRKTLRGRDLLWTIPAR